MIQRVKALSQSRFVRNVAIVATGTAGAQAITMVFAPIITRLYSPEAFGLLGTFMAILGVLTPIAALTYPIAIVLPKSDADAKSLAKLSAILALLIAAITALVLMISGGWIADALNLGAIAGFMLLIPVAMLFSAYQQILTQWFIRKKQFKITARVAVIHALIINSIKAGVGWYHPVGAALIVTATIGHALHGALLWFSIRGKISYSSQDQSTGTVRELAKRHSDFPLYRAPQVAINAFSQSLPVLMLASFFGPAAAGFYTLGKTVMGVPSTLIGNSVGDVFYPRITDAAHNKENLFRLILKATLALAAVGFIPFALVIAFGSWLFSFVFGSEWVTAGEYARWLALWLYFGFMNKPAVVAVPALDMQPWLLFYELFSTASKLVGLAWGFFYMKSDIHAVAMMCILGVAAYVILILGVLKKAYVVNLYEKAGK